MGGSSSKNVMDIHTDVSTNVVNENLVSCSSTNTATQSVHQGGIGNVMRDIYMNQSVDVNVNCVNNTKNNNELQQRLANSTEQTAKALGVSLLPALSTAKSKNETYISNVLSSNLTNKNIATLALNTDLSQSIVQTGKDNLMQNVNLNQSAKAAGQIAQTAINSNKGLQDVVNAASQTAEATLENPLDAITDMIGEVMDGMAGMWIATVIAIGCVAVVFLYLISAFLMGGGEIEMDEYGNPVAKGPSMQPTYDPYQDYTPQDQSPYMQDYASQGYAPTQAPMTQDYQPLAPMPMN